MSGQAARRSDVSIGDLFSGFFMMGICGFGGMLPWARRTIVEQRQWLSPTEFNDLLALCQFLPGPNVIGMSLALGARFRGAAGAAAALVGLMAAPMAIVIGLGVIYAQFENNPVVRHAFAGLAAAASGLVVTTALKICAPLRVSWLDMAIAAVAFVVVAVLRLPLGPAMLVMTPLAIGVAWIRWRAR